MLITAKESKEFIESKAPGFKPDIALVTGSGLGGATPVLSNKVTIPIASIPHIPRTTVPGHEGQVVLGQANGKNLLVLNGRFHLYEGHTPDAVTYPVHLIDVFGIKTMICVNAAGGINPRFKPGDLMMIEDHINFTGVNPLSGGVNGSGSLKFVDMTQAYSSRLLDKLTLASDRAQIPLWRGVYLATTGPSYETPAEIKAYAWMGADAVGMSTVPEVIVARYHNIEVVGISCISNLGAGISSRKLSHEDVLAVSRSSQDNLRKVLTELLAIL
jgi:purine-nucleoside phosphorylase